jgi:hypothetical protein
MRLTLRTMLAYLDGILEPHDAEDIGKKIEESESATKIYHRIRDVIRRLRLAAPSVTERGPGMDPNTVAEYLDNVLPADRVPDFEKVCLESDVHLAEVASCHQILTLVLGEPAEIDPAARERMYQLPEATAKAKEERRAAARAPVFGDGTGDGAAAASKSRTKPMVPEYLREPTKGRRLLPVAALLVLAGCFVGVVLLAFGQFERGTVVGNLLRRAHLIAEQAPEETPDRDASDETKTSASVHPDGKSAVASQPTKEGEAPATPAQEGEEPALLPPMNTKPATDVPTPKPEGVVIATPVVKPDADVPAVPGEKPKPAAVGPGIESPSKPSADMVAKAEPDLPIGPAGNPLREPPPDEPGKAGPAVPPAQRAGQFISDGQEVLLKFDPTASTWQRVPAEDFLVAPARLLALPAFRPKIVLTARAAVELLGGTQIELLPEGAEGPAGIKVSFGRIVVKPLAQPAARVRIVAGRLSATMTLADPEAITALEVVPIHLAGANPAAGPAPMAVDLYVARGEALWEEGSGAKPLRLSAPAHLTVATPDVAPPRAGGASAGNDLPKWILAEPIAPLDRRAAAALAESLSKPGRSASLGLMEVSDDRRKEVRWLATRALGYLGQFEPMVTALNDPARRTEWPDYVEQLRLAVARGPETAAAVLQAIEKQFGQEAPPFYRMLWGYTDKDLQNGEDARLVGFLDHETSAFRVLAFWNLKDLTGLGLFYKPEDTAAKRQRSVATWKKRRDAGEIRISAGVPAEPAKPPVSPDVVPVPAETPEEVPEKADLSPPDKPQPASAF